MGVAGTILLGFFTSIIWNAVGYLMCLCIFTMEGGPFDFFNPRWIYAHVRVNIIGCILLTTFAHILCPVVAIGYWICKICTVGRKY